MSCLETMEKIGLYIMLFSILSLYLFKLPLPGPVILKPALMGLLEITTGIQTICEHTSGLTGLLLVTASVAFGGISGIFQTRSVLTMHSGRKMPDSPSGIISSGKPFTVYFPAYSFGFS